MTVSDTTNDIHCSFLLRHLLRQGSFRFEFHFVLLKCHPRDGPPLKHEPPLETMGKVGQIELQ